MNEQIKEYLEKYPDGIVCLFCELRALVFGSTASDLQETLWAKLPSYVAGDRYVRLIPFKDHINIEAKAVMKHREALYGYRITPKGMLQIGLKQDIPVDTLKQIFTETLEA